MYAFSFHKKKLALLANVLGGETWNSEIIDNCNNLIVYKKYMRSESKSEKSIKNSFKMSH